MILHDGKGIPIVIPDSMTKEQFAAIYDEAVEHGLIIVQGNDMLDFKNLSADWINNANSAYSAMKSAMDTLGSNGLPMFISTDQHGRGIEQHRFVHNLDFKGVGLYNINLGDSVVDYYNYTELGKLKDRGVGIRNYIAVVGNHDNYHSTNHELVSQGVIKTIFGTTCTNVRLCDSDSATYCVYDTARKIKILVIDSYAESETNRKFALSKEAVDFTLSELSVNDGYDVVMLCHWYFYNNNETVYEKIDGTSWIYQPGSTSIYQDLSRLAVNRRNKLSGTINDADGDVHEYDFSSCNGNLLCALHGHNHEEMTALDNTLRLYAADLYGNRNNCVFAIVDKTSNKLRLWRFSDEKIYDEVQLSLA